MTHPLAKYPAVNTRKGSVGNKCYGVIIMFHELRAKGKSIRVIVREAVLDLTNLIITNIGNKIMNFKKIPFRA
ncbi:hypothetical protein cpu_16880 [Carboxydothermus pertinax]|uniref:Transposase n=1 Tax=Carboxydothermus pertinax TaxID=870242 RepID=A0A1L8CW79_9THEO|nr:hypothetical protein cpu_16880 [Carboxydothermus pertinax]